MEKEKRHECPQKNSLSITLFSLFLVFQIGLSISGLYKCNEERHQHGLPEISYLQYVISNDFLEITMENWESEFLQMFAYVLLTTFLYQKGSSESKIPGKIESMDRTPDPKRAGAPWPVRRGGLVLRLYQNSLSLTLFLLFAFSLVLHAVGGVGVYNEQAHLHGDPAINIFNYLTTSQFWYESLQNWQSEFFSIAMLVVLTIFLRQKGCPQSKPVDAPHSQTGT